MAEESLIQSEPVIAPQPLTGSRPLKYALFALAGFLLLGGTTYAGYWYGTESAKLKEQGVKPQSKTQIPETLTPEPTPTLVEEQIYPALTPKEVTEDFYTWYLECLDKHFQSETGKSPREDCPWEKSEYVSEKLLEATKNVQGFDPILCAQDTPRSITVSKASVSGENASVIVTEDFIGNPSLKVDLKLSNSQWKITNITCPTP